MKNIFITYKELLEENNGVTPSYDQLLSTIEWRDFRKVILRRDNRQCQLCKRNGNQLAWELKKNMGIDLYVRQNNEIEKKYLGEEYSYSSKHVELHVHHKFYIKDHHPWEYNEDALITLCMDCHENVHETEKINVYIKEDQEELLLTENCSRCNGKGYIEEYKYHMRGICFSCDGRGYKIIDQ